MPAHNAQSFVSDSIDSVINQTYQEWELIIINDGSTDQTKEICEKYCLLDERIKLINQFNKKQGGARNAGLRISKGEWIAFLDADDLWIPTKLNEQLILAATFPDVDVVFTGGCIFFNNDLKNIQHYTVPNGRFASAEMYKMLYEKNQIPVLSVILKRSAMEKVGFQEEQTLFQGCEDLDYWIRIAETESIFYGMKEELFFYRRHNSNMSSNNSIMVLAQTAVLIKNYNRDKFTKAEAKRIFKPLLNHLVFILTNSNNQKNIESLLRDVSKKIPATYFRISALLFKRLGVYSILPLRVLNKFDNLTYSLLKKDKI